MRCLSPPEVLRTTFLRSRHTAVADAAPIMLERFFVYHPELGGECDAENKIMFFHPADTPLGEQVRLVGLSEALSNFAVSFGAAGDCEAMHTQNRRHVFMQAEKNLWFVLVARNPPGAGDGSGRSRRESGPVSPVGSPRPGESPGAAERDVDPEVGDNEEELQDGHLMAVLRRIYGTLRLFCGPLSDALRRGGPPALKALLAGFLERYLDLLGAGGELDFAASDVLDAMDGMRFLPVDQRLYLRAQYVVNLVQCTFPSVHNCMLLHQARARRPAAAPLCPVPPRGLMLRLSPPPVVRTPPVQEDCALTPSRLPRSLARARTSWCGPV